MKFLINRASDVLEGEKPCENARKCSYIAKYSDNKEYEHEGWYIELNTLEELIQFMYEENEDIIIRMKRVHKPIEQIIIYDDWIE